MNEAPPGHVQEGGNGAGMRLGRGLLVTGGLLCLLLAAALRCSWPQQAVLAGLLIGLTFWMHRVSRSHLVTLMLMLLSCFCTARYGLWRFGGLRQFFGDPGVAWTPLDAVFLPLLFLAECYAFLSLFLGYLQTLWPLRRRPVPMPGETALWPAVDLLIPTYNEPLSVVKYTALAALNLDWPADRLHVYVLDDGRREEFRAFCEEAGLGYITRPDNRFAKAGNLNHALKELRSPFVAIFDSDHVPTRSFLQLTMGWFGRDPKLAMLQTPHHFYSPDPFERNLHQFRVVPNEGELFYGVVQDGNDFWNATFFCGSCAVMRRAALDEVGGIAVETVTEDAHTSLRLQMRGWNTAYINIPQAAGLATERLSSHVRQRIRWARGMVQVLRLENPLFAPGLSAAQRLCYFNAMSHFLYALPRLIFLTAPLLYLLFGRTNIPGFWAAILAYAAPHLLLSSVTHSRVQGRHRHSFWNEIYETVLAPYLFLPTMLALANPRLGRFQVTAKGGVVNRDFFDKRVATPFLVLLLLNGLGLLCAVPRLVRFPHMPVLPLGMGALLNLPANLYDGAHRGTVWLNVAWTLVNLTVLAVATAVAAESQQRRHTVRVQMTVPAGVVLADGSLLQGATTDISSGGVMIRGEAPVKARAGDAVRLIFPVLDGTATLPATVIAAHEGGLRAHFDPLTLEQEEALTAVLYSRADTWLGWGEARQVDRPLVSIWRIVRLAIRGLASAARGLLPFRKAASGRQYAGALMVLACVTLGVSSSGRAKAQEAAKTAAPPVPAVGKASTSLVNPGVGAPFQLSLPLRGFVQGQSLQLSGAEATRTVRFALPRSKVVQSGRLRLVYAASPAMAPGLSQLLVSLNGSLVRTLSVPAPAGDEGHANGEASAGAASGGLGAGQLTAEIALPAALLQPENELRFELIARAVKRQEATPLWVRLAPGSTLELAGSARLMRDDLSQLPLPFLDGVPGDTAPVRIALLGDVSAHALEAAGVVASWTGVLGGERLPSLEVYVGEVPLGNAIVLSSSFRALPAELRLEGSEGPTIAMRSNPRDPASKLLVLAGDDAGEMLTAARVLALEQGQLAGATAHVSLRQPHPLRRADDAPRWLGQSMVRLGDLAGGDRLESDGSEPVQVTFRLPPDAYFGTAQNLPLELFYRYNGVPLGRGSTLNLEVNGHFVSATPMPHNGMASANLATVVPVPISTLQPFVNTLQGQFAFVRESGAGDSDGGATVQNLAGAVLPDSYLDLRGETHLAMLPNLRLFANAGYPFTRMADLSETSVVLPDAPSTEVLKLYLSLMAYFGQQTGFSAVNVRVTDVAGMDDGRDLLVLGTSDDVPALERLREQMPVRVGPDGVHVQDTTGVWARWRRLWARLGGELEEEEPASVAEATLRGAPPAALLEGFGWHGRSVVVMDVRDRAAMEGFLPAFLAMAQGSAIARSVSVWSGANFQSYRLGGDAYEVGTVSALGRLELFFARSPWTLVLCLGVVCFVVAGALRSSLRARARRRAEALV